MISFITIDGDPAKAIHWSGTVVFKGMRYPGGRWIVWTKGEWWVVDDARLQLLMPPSKAARVSREDGDRTAMQFRKGA